MYTHPHTHTPTHPHTLTASSVWTARNINKSIPFFPFNSDNIDPALEGFIRFWTFLILFQVCTHTHTHTHIYVLLVVSQFVSQYNVSILICKSVFYEYPDQVTKYHVLQVIIPISLYVTMEVVKFTQIYFLNWDRAMYYAPTDRPFECRALNITEDLGQIQYVFSDKTGTLTENEMVFKCCSIGSINYPHSLKGGGVKMCVCHILIFYHSVFKDEFTKYGVDINASMIMHTAALEGDHDYEKQEETDFPQPLVSVCTTISAAYCTLALIISSAYIFTRSCSNRHNHLPFQIAGGDD